MKKLLLIILTLSAIIITGCNTVDIPDRNFRQDMRDFVGGISTYAKGINPNFIIIPQNGHELLTLNGEVDGTPAIDYLNAIDGVGREDLFYGYSNDNQATPDSPRNEMLDFMDVAESNGVEVLVTDYCWTKSYVDNSYAENTAKNYISFAAARRELDSIPTYPTNPYNANTANISSLGQAQNFLYLINPGAFTTKENFLHAVQNTNYDAIIIDLFYDGTVELTPGDIAALKVKANGGTRLLIAYMSIGEAEDYRYYWQGNWDTTPPAWLAEENNNWAGNYKVQYWDEDWQKIIYGNDTSYLKKILDAGFDGVYLDIIDAFEYFEIKE